MLIFVSCYFFNILLRVLFCILVFCFVNLRLCKFNTFQYSLYIFYQVLIVELHGSPSNKYVGENKKLCFAHHKTHQESNL